MVLSEFKLRQFEEDPLYSEALKYWYEKWDSTANDVKKGAIGTNIINIRMVLTDIINEYELNKFESENNRKIYINLIQKFIKEQHLKLYKPELLILKEYLEAKDGQAAYVLSKDLSETFSNESFAQILFDELLKLLREKSFKKSHREKISSLTKDIIIDLVTAGRAIKDVTNMCEEAFRTYTIISDDRLITKYKYIPEGLSDTEAREYIDNLNLEKRLAIFRDRLKAQEDDYIFVFPVWGLLFTPTLENQKLFGFTIYNPAIEKKFGDERANENFVAFRKSEDEEATMTSRCNVVIYTKAISFENAKKQATEQYLLFLDLLNLHFSEEFKEVFWDEQFIGKKITSKEFISSFGAIREERTFRRKLSIQDPIRYTVEKNKTIKKYSELIRILQERKMFVELNSIINVIELMSKSKWETEENKLLNYWICLESLANISKREKDSKFKFIKETISNMYFLWEQYRPLHELFNLTAFYVEYLFGKDSTIDIPHEFISDTHLREAYFKEEGVSLSNFNKRKHELKNYTQKVSFLDEIENTLEFYQKNDTALKRMNAKRTEVQLMIDYIYKTRNQIVHNGYAAKNLIPYLVNFAASYANALLARIIDAYNDGEFNLKDYFIKEMYQATLLEKKLASKDEFYNLEIR